MTRLMFVKHLVATPIFRCQGIIPSLVNRRLYSAVTAPPRREHIEVPCRSNGSITIDVYHALETSAPILIYLPPGPVLPHGAEDEEHVITALHASSAATIARINYRASEKHPYPTPYHDVLFGYDWIREHLLRDEFKRHFLGRLGVCGQLIGGSLATMLSLTECRVGESRIIATAVNNPIVDWVFPDDLPFVDASELPEPAAVEKTAFPADENPASSDVLQTIKDEILKMNRKPRKRAKKAPPLTSWQAHGDNSVIPALTLSAERDMLFRKPEHYFDRFASPIHFFRSPHAQLVVPLPDNIAASQHPDELLDIETQFALSHYATFNDKVKTTPVVPALARCRAYARSYPQSGTNLSFPAWNITTGLQSPLSDHALELGKVLQRSIARQTLKSHSGRTRWHDAAEKARYAEFASDQVQVTTLDGVGLWAHQDNSEDWKPRVEEVGAWMKLRLATNNA